jgi:hypothetical protein
MDNRDHIGEYAARVRENDPLGEDALTKFHRVETRRADRFITHCGREMDYEAPKGHLIFEIAVDSTARCLRC